MDDVGALRSFRAWLAVPDVRARARVRARTERLIADRYRAPWRLTRRPVVIVVAAAALVASAALAAAGSGVLDLVGVQQQPGTPVPNTSGTVIRYVLGDQLFGVPGGPQQLGALSTGETAWSDAVLSPDGSKLLYEAANSDGQPGTALRLHDLASGADQTLAADAFAPVWGADGRIAYGKTEQRRSSGGDVGAEIPARVEVRATPTASPVDWIATPGAYFPVAWAGKRLLVEQLAADGTAPSLLALDGPGQTELLAVGSLEALSPDGHLALISDGSVGGRPTGPLLQLIDTTNGAVQATLDLRQATVDGLSWGALAPAGPGDWSIDNIVLPDAAGALVLSAHQDVLTIEKVARFSGDPGIRGAEYHEARYLNASGQQIIVKADVLPPSGNGGQMLQSVLVCDLSNSTCVRGSDAGTPNHWLGLVTNPSRPLP